MGFGFDAPFDLNAFEQTYSGLRPAGPAGQQLISPTVRARDLDSIALDALRVFGLATRDTAPPASLAGGAR